MQTVVHIIKQDLCERKRGTGRKRRVKRAVDKAMAVSCANNARSWFQENSTTFIACGSYLSLSRASALLVLRPSLFVHNVPGSMSQYQFFYRTRLGIFGSWTSILDEGRDDDVPHTWVARKRRKKKKDGEKRTVEEKKLKRSTVVGCWEQGQCVRGNFEIKLHQRFSRRNLEIPWRFQISRYNFNKFTRREK